MNADKKRIWIKGEPIEVTDEVFDAYIIGDRKNRYFEDDLKTERAILGKDGQTKRLIPSREVSLDGLVINKAIQFPAAQESIEDLVFHKISIERLHIALSKLTNEERGLIEALFFEDMTERAYAEKIGVYRNAVHKRKVRILKKLKKFLE